MPKFFSDVHFSGSSTDLTIDGNVTASSGTGHFSLVNSSAYQLNGTYVMDSSRNLVNIGTITSGNITTASRITFDYNGSGSGNNYIETGTNSIAFKNSSGTSTLQLNFSNQSSTFAGEVSGIHDLYAYKLYDSQNTNYYADLNNSNTSLNAAGSATFGGAITIANTGVSQTSPTTQLLIDNNNIDDGGGYNIDFKTSSNDTANRFMARIQALRGSSAISSLGFFTETGSALTRALLLDSSQNATFGGNIGLGGATSPNRLLHVDNTSSAATASAYFYTNAQHTGSTTQAHVSIYSDNASSTGQTLFVRGDGTGDLLVLNKGGTNKMVVTDDGDVTATSFTGDGSNLTNISAPSNMVTTDTTQTISGTKTFSVQPTFNADTLHNGHIYGRSVNNQYSFLYRFGGLFFTWDSDSYGTNTHHSIRSTYGDSFADSITLNSYNHFRVNIDSNNNNSSSYFEVGDGTTGTGYIKFRVDNQGRVYSTNGYYDLDDTSYFIKPADATAIQVKGRILSYNPAGGNLSLRTTYAKRYGINSEDNHVTALTNEGWTDGGTSNRAVTALVLGNTDWGTSGSKDMLALTRVNTAAYTPSSGQGSYQKVFSVRGSGDLHLGYNTNTGAVYATKYYDKASTGYYLDPASTTTSLNVAGGATIQKQLVIDSDGSTDNYYITMNEAGSNRFTIYENSNNVYFNGWAGHTIFRPQMAGSGSFAVTQGNNQMSTSGAANFAASVTSPIFYDTSTAYYLDPASSSIALNINGIIDQNFEQTDLNTAWTTPGNSFAEGFIVGRYQASASNIPSNNDNANWFMNIYSHSTGGTASYGIQLAGSNASSGENALSLRNVSNGSFSSWRKVYHEGHKPTLSELGYTGATNANYITNNNQLTNGAGYTTNTGTTTASNTQTFTNKSGNISQWTNDSGYLTSVPSNASALNLNATDDRDMAPEDLAYSDDMRIFFSAREGLEDGTSTGTDWQDVLLLNSYSDSSGGAANILAFDKNSYKIRHYQAALSASNWGTAKELAYTSNSGTITATQFIDTDNTNYYLDPAGTSQVNSIEFVGSTNNARIGQPVSSEWGTRITTDSGYILFGPANTSHAHIYTDRSNFYFNKQIQLLGGSLINQNDIRSKIFYDADDTNYYVNPATGSVLGGTVTIHNDSDSAVSIQNAGTNAVGIYAHAGDELYLGSNNASKLRLHSGGAVESYADFRAPIFYDSNDTNYYVNPASTTQLNNLDVAGTLEFSNITTNRMMGYHDSIFAAKYGTLGVDVNGKIGVAEKEITFSVEGTGWVGRHSNPVKILDAPGADKMIVVQEINMLILYTAPIGIGSSGIARTTDNTAYAVGFFQGSGTNGNFTVTGVMPRNTMQHTTTTNARIVNRDVPVEGTKLYPNKALYWKTTRDAANNSSSYPGAQHIIKIKYRILDVSTEFTGAYANAQNINSSSITSISQAF